MARKNNNATIPSLPKSSLIKKATFRGDEDLQTGRDNHLGLPDRDMFSPDVSSSNMDHTENMDNVNDLFDPAN